MKKILTTLVFLFFVTMTVTFAQSKVVEYRESSARNVEPVHSVLTAPLIADLQILGDKISYTEKDAFAQYPVSAEIVAHVPNFKKVALNNAARAHKADVIIGATVDIITNQQGRLEITISGYPAKYTNFRNATSQDLDVVMKGLQATAMGVNGNFITNPLDPHVQNK